MIKENIKMAVFDMAGTTIDEQKTVYRSVGEALAEFGFEYSLETIVHKIGGMNKREGIALLMRESGEAITEEAVEVVFRLFKKNVEAAYESARGLKEMKGASALFSYLKSNHIKVVLDTGYHRSTADLLIDKMGWEDQDLIDFSVTSDEVEEGRPQPHMIRLAMEALGVENPQTIMKVGDTQSDIDEGRNAGCGIIVGISSDQYSREQLLSMGATHAIDQFSEIIQILEAQ
ncbi:HAD-IA family hydrolase [Roseivirga sp. UBA1976]|uniref:HAD-IA family hydrolase n=1 Tax=Roseivirga sp. UBA1976 TaxID=1947386 RepID=UPI00257CDC08|nr:HAD-IA family hydrolase [Roseivirga sp. UBA1976]|tara:strand:- start:7919 stop:8611 length:693 start_codon:yes stop_codon:yes gene_type:complete